MTMMMRNRNRTMAMPAASFGVGQQQQQREQPSERVLCSVLPEAISARKFQAKMKLTSASICAKRHFVPRLHCPCWKNSQGEDAEGFLADIFMEG